MAIPTITEAIAAYKLWAQGQTLSPPTDDPYLFPNEVLAAVCLYLLADAEPGTGGDSGGTVGGSTAALQQDILDALALPLSIDDSTPLAVSASIDTTGLATDSGQATALAQLQAIAAALAAPLEIDDTTPIAVSTGLTGLAANSTLQDVETAVEAVTAALGGTLSVSTGLTGLSTAANQATGNATLSAIDAKLGGTLAVNTGLSTAALATAAKQDTALTHLQAIASALGGSLTVNTGLTGLASETTAAATLAKLNGTVTVNTGLTGLATQTTLNTRASETTAAAINTKLAGNVSTVRAKGTPAQGSVTVATAGTAIALPTKALTNYVMLQWHPANTGPIYFGAAGVANNYAGPYLDAGNPRIVLEVSNANLISVNADTSADKVLYYAS